MIDVDQAREQVSCLRDRLTGANETHLVHGIPE